MSIYIYTHANQQHRLLCVRSNTIRSAAHRRLETLAQCAPCIYKCILYIIKLVKTNKLQCRAREALMSKDGNLSDPRSRLISIYIAQCHRTWGTDEKSYWHQRRCWLRCRGDLIGKWRVPSRLVNCRALTQKLWRTAQAESTLFQNNEVFIQRCK
jgi:hypothetical protein